MSEPLHKHNERSDFRISESAKAMVQRAAEISGMSYSAFVRFQALEAAKRILSDQEMLRLSNEDRDLFLRLLDHAPAPTESLKKALKRHTRKYE